MRCPNSQTGRSRGFLNWTALHRMFITPAPDTITRRRFPIIPGLEGGRYRGGDRSRMCESEVELSVAKMPLTAPGNWKRAAYPSRSPTVLTHLTPVHRSCHDKIAITSSPELARRWPVFPPGESKSGVIFSAVRSARPGNWARWSRVVFLADTDVSSNLLGGFSEGGGRQEFSKGMVRAPCYLTSMSASLR